MKFRSILKVVDSQPLAICLLGHSRSQRAWREIQGENLRLQLQDIKNKLEEILHVLRNVHLAGIRQEFPRFYFLSDLELIGLISDSSLHQNSRAQACISKCFNGVEYLISPSNVSVNPIEKEQIAGVAGTNGSKLIFNAPIIISSKKFMWEKWLKEVDKNIKVNLPFQFHKAFDYFRKMGGFAILASDLGKFLETFGTQIALLILHMVITIKIQEIFSLSEHQFSEHLMTLKVR